MATTVLIISLAYSRLIEEFPSGGGGYVVATKLLGPRAGVTSGSALLVDYVLTITTSLAAAGDAIFSFLPASYATVKLPVEIGFLLFLTVLNIRGVRESVLALTPIFLVFLVTHAVLIGGGIIAHGGNSGAIVTEVHQGYQQGISLLGVGGLLLLFVRAFSLGGGTYTGIEAVSNGLTIMREPRVRTAKRTMLYMAVSLAVTASGLLLCYLLWHIVPEAGKTMNDLLAERMTSGIPGGKVFTIVTLFSEGALLVVAAQAGFLDGPRVLANMAIDSWVPHRFSALSERLTTRNGIVLMGLGSLVALLYTGGHVDQLIVMYSINVFLTFSLSMFAMFRFWWREKERGRAERWRRLMLFAAGFALCATVLVITVIEKFRQGGWVTVAVTAVVIALCFSIRRHYADSDARMRQLFEELGDLPKSAAAVAPVAPATSKPVAAILVGSYGGVGIHTMLNVWRAFPGYYQGIVFIGVGVVDSGEFKGEHALDQLRERTAAMLAQYVALATSLGIAATSRSAVGTEVVAEATAVALHVAGEYPKATFFAGKLIFRRDSWWLRLLHNETPLAIQKRLQWAGKMMVTLPVRVREG